MNGTDRTKNGARAGRRTKSTGLPIETRRLRLRKCETRDAIDIVSDSAEADFRLARSLDWKPTEESVRAYCESRFQATPESKPEWMDLVNVGIGVHHAEVRDALRA